MNFYLYKMIYPYMNRYLSQVSYFSFSKEESEAE